MGSINAKAVAREVTRRVRNGKLVNLEKITQEQGYSRKSAIAQKAKRTKTFQKEMKPLIDGMEKEIDKIKKEMGNRDLTHEKYIELAKVMDILIKNHQLLSGKPTEINKREYDEDQLKAIAEEISKH